VQAVGGDTAGAAGDDEQVVGGDLRDCGRVCLVRRGRECDRAPPGRVVRHVGVPGRQVVELAEEAGREAGSLVKLCDVHTSKSIMRETAHLYVARDLRPASRPADSTEFIERRLFPFAEVLRMVERAEIKDSMTVIAMLHAARLLSR